MLIIPVMDRRSDQFLYDLQAAWRRCGETVTAAGDLSFLIYHRSYWDASSDLLRNVMPNNNYANAYGSGTLLGTFM
jgi:hypothetical protein